MASLSPWSLIFLFGIIILVIYALYFLAFKKWVSKPLSEDPPKKKLVNNVFIFYFPALTDIAHSRWNGNFALNERIRIFSPECFYQSFCNEPGVESILYPCGGRKPDSVGRFLSGSGSSGNHG